MDRRVGRRDVHGEAHQAPRDGGTPTAARIVVSAMSFAKELAAIRQEDRDQGANAVFVGTVVEMRDSIKFGSATTGAPAMPVAPGQFKRAGALRDSVTVNYPDANTALIYTTSPYAQDVEDNAKGTQFARGGPHGWKLTVAAFSRVVDGGAASGRSRSVIDHVAYQFALRQKLATLVVATTGVLTLSATATGFARTAGSFLDDGFDIGMEITPTGFATNVSRIVTGVSALDITVSGSATPEVAAGGRTIAALLPSQLAWENIAFQPTSGVPWVREEYLPGPAAQVTVGPLGEIEAFPQYALYVSVAADTGLAVSRYADALMRLFAPRTAIALANGDVLRVRSDTGPYAGQMQQSQPGFAVKPVTFPLRIRTANSI
jgi:hypothetical protein